MPPFADEVIRCRPAQHAWSRLPVAERLQPVARLRRLLVERTEALIAAVAADVGRNPDEVIATDLLPTAAAAKFLLGNAQRLLAPRRVRGTPIWLWDCRDTLHHRPHGVVGLIATWNYPIFLTLVPVLQALTAGNGILWKPSEQTHRTAGVLSKLFKDAGYPDDIVIALPCTREAGPQLAEADIDLVHFTGSDRVGRTLASRLGERLIPSVLELSGCDAAFVFADADPTMAARCVWYGTTLNGGQTCMAIRRAFVHRSIQEAFVQQLRLLVQASPGAQLVTAGQREQMQRLVHEARERGAEVLTSAIGGDTAATVLLNPPADVAAIWEASFCPLLSVLPFDTPEEALALHDRSPLALAGAVFSADAEMAEHFAASLPLGSVVINDVIVPTAHPATPFGGRRASGWGVTQGAEGLLQMTVPQVVSTRRGRFRPHVDSHLGQDPSARNVAQGILRLSHGGWRDTFGGLRQLIRGLRGKA